MPRYVPISFVIRISRQSKLWDNRLKQDSGYLGFLYAPVPHSAIWLNACIPVSIFLLSYLCMRNSVQKDEARVFMTILSSIICMLMVAYFTQSYIFSIGDLCFLLARYFGQPIPY